MDDKEIYAEVLSIVFSCTIVGTLFRGILHFDAEIVFEAVMVSCVASLLVVLIKVLRARRKKNQTENDEDDEEKYDEYDDDDDDF